MGLFSSKKIIQVASTVYNLAGESDDRTNFLKANVFSSVLGNNNQYLGEVLVNNYLHGPGMKQRQFFNWAVRNSYEGLPTSTIQNITKVDGALVTPHVPVTAGLNVVVGSAYVSDGDFSVFAEQHILQNSPELIDTAWASEYIKSNHTIKIIYEDTSEEIISAGVYNVNKKFLVVNYVNQGVDSDTTTITNQDNLEDESTLPDVSSMTLDSTTINPVNSPILTADNEILYEYDDGTPSYTENSVTYSAAGSVDEEVKVYSESYYNGNTNGGDEVSSSNVTVEIIKNYVIEVVRTVTVEVNGPETKTTTIDQDTVFPRWHSETTEVVTTNGTIVDGSQMWIYQIGDGNVVLDNLAPVVQDLSTYEFYPFIPVRLDNESITEFNDLYESSRLAYKRATNGDSFSDLVAQVEDNEDLDDIDYAYIVYGVSMNEKDNTCRKYLYQFYKDLIPFQNTDSSYMSTLEANIDSYSNNVAEMEAWRIAQSNRLDPLWNTPRPANPDIEEPETTTIQVKTDNAATDDFDTRISFIHIDEEVFVGVGMVDAKEGDVWLEKGPALTWDIVTFRYGQGDDNSQDIIGTNVDTQEIETTYIYYQTSANSYNRLTIRGLIHNNYIYGGKSVRITANEALDDDDTSGFIVPLHNPTVRNLSLVDATQMATANTFIVFNSYQVTKKKWYQSFLGGLFLIFLVILGGALIAPGLIGGATGLFGVNAVVGAGLGLTGLSAIVAGAAINAFAAILVAKAISPLAVEVFGEKWGAIFAAIATFAVTFGAANGFSALNVSNLLQPSNLLQFSSALANGYSGYVQADIAEMGSDLLALGEQFDEQMDDINDMIRDLGGSNDLSFDPMQLTDVNAGNDLQTGSYIPESLDEFIHRTTLTGGDIVDVTLSMVENYAELNLQLPND